MVKRCRLYNYQSNLIIPRFVVEDDEPLHWNVRNACSFHDIHGSLRWATKPYSSAELLSDLFIVFESLRNAYAAIARKVIVFVTQYVRYEGQESAEEAKNFWERVGVTADLIDVVSSVNPTWKN